MHLLEVIGWFLAGKAGELAVAGRNAIANLQRLALACAVLPLLIVLVGIMLGLHADAAFDTTGIHTARTMVNIGSVIGFLTSAVLIVRISILVYEVVGLSAVANAAVEAVPSLPQDKADKLIEWLSGTLAWLVVGYLVIIFINAGVPIWLRLIPFSLIMGACTMLMLGCKWVKPTWGRPALYYGGIAFVIVAIVYCVSPNLAQATDDARRKYLGDGDLAGIVEARNRQMKEMDAAYLNSLVKEQMEIHQRAMTECGGTYCPGDGEKFRALEEKVRRVKASSSLEREETAAAEPEAVPAAKAPPAKVAKGAEPEATAAKPRRSSGDKVIDSVWSALDSL